MKGTYISFIIFLSLPNTGQQPTMIPHVAHCSPVQYLRIGESGTIQCNFQDHIGIIWFQDGVEGPVAYIQESRKGGSGYDRNELDIAANGSLIISNVTAKHEGTFHVAIVISQTHSEQETIQTIAIGVPLNAYPVVDGCPQENECSLTVNRNDTLTCSLKGIRPAVNLEWRVNEPDSRFNFVKERLVVQMTGDVYDVELSSQFTVSYLPRRIAIHCIPTGPNTDLFNISKTEVILLFAFDKMNGEDRTKTTSISAEKVLPYVQIGLPTILMLILLTIFCCMLKKDGKCPWQQNSRIQGDTSAISGNNNTPCTSSSVNTASEAEANRLLGGGSDDGDRNRSNTMEMTVLQEQTPVHSFGQTAT